MKRFVTYLFRYRNGEKRKNAGHIRVRVQNGMLHMQINIKDFELGQERGVLYIIVKQEKVYGISLGELSISYGQYQGMLSYDGKLPLQDVIGVGICYNNGIYMASCWKEGEEENIANADFLKKEEETEEKLEVQNLTADEIEVNVPNFMEKKAEMKEETEEKLEIQNLTADEIETDAENMIEKKEISSEEEISLESEEQEKIKNESEQTEIRVEETERVVSCRKINLNEICHLPSHLWYLSNNSFLLHGFWNYGYLVLKEEVEANETKVSLGVPGIFEQPEMVMATYFGFPKFETASSEMEKMEIGEPWAGNEETERTLPQEGTFGVWFTL